MTQPQPPENLPPLPRATPVPLPYATPLGGLPGTPAEQQYAIVPWYRKNGLVSLFVLLGLCVGPLLIAACVIVLTGPVYYPKLGADGRLRQWGAANKVVAVILLALWIWFFASRLLRL